jgi:uncharacterized protein
MNKFLAFLLFFALIIVSIFVFNIKDSLPFKNISEVNGQIAATPIKLEVANNGITRARGLSNRNQLEEGRGMLFVFTETEKPGFWMKDMRFPIDIIWINDNLKIVEANKNISPNTYPTVFYPTSPVKYVIEVPAGYFDRHLLKIGDSISLESQNLILESTF